MLIACGVIPWCVYDVKGLTGFLMTSLHFCSPNLRFHILAHLRVRSMVNLMSDHVVASSAISSANSRADIWVCNILGCTPGACLASRYIRSFI